MDEIKDVVKEQIRQDIEEELMEEIGFTVISQKSAQAMWNWAINHGHTKAEADELIATAFLVHGE